MFSVESKDFKTYKENLERTAKYAFPDAVKSTLNNLAYKTSVEYKKNIKKELTIRGGQNNIVLKSVHYEKCPNGHDISKMESKVGQQASTYGRPTEQLKKQELGEPIIAKSKHTYKATRFTRGGNYKRTVPFNRFVANTNAQKISDLVEHPATGARKQFAQAVGVAHHAHKTINFIPDNEESGKKFGIFQLRDTGGKEKAKGKSAKLLYSFKDKTQQLHKRPMLKPATDKIAPKAGEVFVHEAERRISKEMSKGLKSS